MFDQGIVDILKRGGIGILPTDTLYGVVGRADKQDTVETIYTLKERNPTKPFIILISRIEDVAQFGISLTNSQVANLKNYWPGAVSVILPLDHEANMSYLHRGTNSLAFRLPSNPELRALLSKTGPLVAPSANPEGQPPATSLDQARSYFSTSVDFYVEGPVNDKPSKIIKLNANDGEIEIIRP